MAQLVERVLGKDEVPGSNPGSSSKKKSRASGFFFLYFSLFSFHSSLFSKSPTRLFQRRDKREERKEKVAFRDGEKQFLFLILKNTPKFAIIKSERR